jgi:HEAT repeat protein
VVGTNQHLEEWAARGFLKAAVPECSPRQLLQTRNPRVTNVGLAALKGEPIDDTLMEQLEGIMRTGPVWVRGSAAEVLVADRSAALAERKARAIVCALGDMAAMDLSVARLRATILTPEEFWYNRFIGYLCGVWEANSEMELPAAPGAGRARDAVMIARSRRGDRDVAAELLRILQDPQAGMFRAWAAEGLGKIGTKDHVEILTRLAQSDEMQRYYPGSLPPPLPDPPVRPVRVAAYQALNEIKAREHLP